MTHKNTVLFITDHMNCGEMNVKYCPINEMLEDYETTTRELVSEILESHSEHPTGG